MKIISLPMVSTPIRFRVGLGVGIVLKVVGLIAASLMVLGSIPDGPLMVTLVTSRSWHFFNALLIDQVVQKPERIENEVEMIFSRREPVPVVSPEVDKQIVEAVVPAKGDDKKITINLPKAVAGKVAPAVKRTKIAVGAKGRDEDRSQVKPSVERERQVESLLTDIRSDPKRIFIDEELIVGDLTWTAKNLSPGKGLEVWVENSRNALNTYYVPYVQFGGGKASFDCNVLAPGSKGVAALPVSSLREKFLVIKVGATGSVSKNWRIRLP